MTDIHLGVRRYLTFVMNDQGLSATALAKKAGIATSTLTRFLNDTAYTFTLSNTTLEKIAKATRENPAPFIKNADFVDLNQSIYGVEEGGENTASDLVITIGEVSPGVWREQMPGEFDSYIHAINSTWFEAKHNFICRVRGFAIEEFAKDGEWLFCTKTDIYLQKYRPHDEMLAVVQTTRDNDLIELTVRLAQKVDDGILFRQIQRVKGPKPKNVKLKSYQDDGPFKVLGFVEFVFRYPILRAYLNAPGTPVDPKIATE